MNIPIWISNKWLYWMYVGALSALVGFFVASQMLSGFSLIETVVGGSVLWAAIQAIKARREFLQWVEN